MMAYTLRAMIIVALMLMLPAGIFLAAWHDNPAWLLLTAAALAFFMAG